MTEFKMRLSSISVRRMLGIKLGGLSCGEATLNARKEAVLKIENRNSVRLGLEGDQAPFLLPLLSFLGAMDALFLSL